MGWYLVRGKRQHTDYCPRTVVAITDEGADGKTKAGVFLYLTLTFFSLLLNAFDLVVKSHGARAKEGGRAWQA